LAKKVCSKEKGYEQDIKNNYVLALEAGKGDSRQLETREMKFLMKVRAKRRSKGIKNAAKSL
jgi:hypothetical protein